MLKQIGDAASSPARQRIIQMGRDLSPETLRALWQHDAEFGEQAAHPVIGRSPFLDESLPGPMQAKRRLLMFVLQRHETHTRTGYGLTDGGRIRRIVLAALARHAIRRYELGRHQPDGMAVPLEHASPV